MVLRAGTTPQLTPVVAKWRRLRLRFSFSLLLVLFSFRHILVLRFSEGICDGSIRPICILQDGSPRVCVRTGGE